MPQEPNYSGGAGQPAQGKNAAVDETVNKSKGAQPQGARFEAIPPNLISAYGCGSFANATTLTVNDVAPWVNIYNQTTASFDVTVTMRVASTPGATVMFVLPPFSGISIPTGAIASLALSSTQASIFWFYTEQRVDWAGVSDPTYPANVSYVGGTAALASGVWHFRATLTVASTPLTVNTVSALPDGTIASIASTATSQEYSFPVVGGTTYTIAGGTVISGFIGVA